MVGRCGHGSESRPTQKLEAETNSILSLLIQKRKTGIAKAIVIQATDLGSFLAYTLAV